MAIKASPVAYENGFVTSTSISRSIPSTVPPNAGNDFLSQVTQSPCELNLMRTNGPVDHPARALRPWNRLLKSWPGL